MQMQNMQFRDAVDALGGCATRAEIAQALGASFYSVKQALLPSDSSAHRPPPPGWQTALARLTRKRARQLTKLADRLEAEADRA